MKTNVIHNQDCIEGMANLPDNSIDLVVTDPPYLMSYKTNRRKNKNHEFCSEIANSENKKLIIDYFKECERVLKKHTAIYCFANSNQIDFFKEHFDEHFNLKI